jgi:hypothetical protein
VPIRTHMFSGRRFKVRNLSGVPVGSLAQCKYHNRTIQIPVRGDTLPELDAVLHEAVHASMPWLDEDVVESASTSMARLLWRLGWRMKGEE